MKSILRSARLSGLMFVVAMMTTSCFFNTSLDVAFSNFGEGRVGVHIFINSSTSYCEIDADSDIYSCTYFPGETEDTPISYFSLTESELVLTFIIFDPVVLQLPLEASDFSGSFLHQASDTAGDLVITAGLNSLRADATQTMQAEPGMQLVVIDLPEDAPTGQYSFNFSFSVPEDMPSLEVKALFTGRVEVDGATFYLPLLPCTSDMTALPTISIPLPEGDLISLPIDDLQGCDNVVYSLGQAALNKRLLLPLVQN